jgi:hypothetical protein
LPIAQYQANGKLTVRFSKNFRYAVLNTFIYATFDTDEKDKTGKLGLKVKKKQVFQDV